MVAGYPTAVFGKPDGSGSYQIIEQHSAFTQTAVARAFQKICGSFEWRSTESETAHAPCFGILPVEEQFLIAKFVDTGRDITGRPHTLRIECILADDCEPAWKNIAAPHPFPDCPPDVITIIGDQSTFSRS